jgi:glutathione S-transferase
MTATIHALPPSHPCLTVQKAFELKGVAFERVELDMTRHNEQMEELYGEGRKTVPGVTFDDGEQVHGSSAIMEALEAREAEPSLYPDGIADRVREAETWGDGELQDLGRRLPWAAFWFRPELLPITLGGEPLDGAGTDYAVRAIRGAWKYHGITFARLQEDLAALPALLDQADAYCAEGVMGGGHATAADLQIGASLHVLHVVEDLWPLLQGRRSSEVATAMFGEQTRTIPAGAYPRGWVPSAG